jgi:2-polyprenyl-6-methoxyphenol hydroxylase-like FAD-dependent oxidoreductase
MPIEGRAVQCCIAGGGPAGMMLGLLLGRAGVETVVLEKHADFLRDFRGDTIHPSTLEVMHELGLLEEFLALPHQRVDRLSGRVGQEEIPIADFTRLPVRCGFIALMPQWTFLDFLARHAKMFPGFRLCMETEAVDLIEEAGVVKGVRAKGPSGPLAIRAALVVGADGRHSTVRERAGLEVETLGAPMDVLWFRLSRAPGDPGQTMGRFEAGRIFVMINHGTHWQIGYVIPKGSAERLRAAGLDRFRDTVAALLPGGGERVAEIRAWDDVKLLTVVVDRLRRWFRPGLLCIGDAAHAMSPVGGVGINLAIQDAVAAANLLAAPLRDGTLTTGDLARVERRRRWPTRVTQRVQVFLQERVIARTLEAHGRQASPPLPLRLLQRHPLLRRVPGRLIGMGVRPEHVQRGAETVAKPDGSE